MLAACGGEAGSGVEVIGCGVEKFNGGEIVGAVRAADDNYGAVEQSCSGMFGARRGHRRTSGNTSRLRIVNIGCRQRVRAIAAAADDDYAAVAQDGCGMILAWRGHRACVREIAGIGIENFEGVQRAAGTLSTGDE